MGREKALRRLLRPRRTAATGLVARADGSRPEQTEGIPPAADGQKAPPVRLLVVDDEPRMVSFLSRALTTCGFDVDCATDEASAFEMATHTDYDVILLDLLLPQVGGFELMQRILEVRPDQEIVALSALSDVDSKVRSFALGASDYVTKPFVVSELIARIRTRSRRRGAPADGVGTPLAVDGLRLDPQRQLATLNGRAVQLSRREYLLLDHLLRRQGQVCSRLELREAVWGFSFDPGTNVVDVYVARLRAKLGHELIDTVRNVGYGYKAAP